MKNLGSNADGVWVCELVVLHRHAHMLILLYTPHKYVCTCSAHNQRVSASYQSVACTAAGWRAAQQHPARMWSPISDNSSISVTILRSSGTHTQHTPERDPRASARFFCVCISLTNSARNHLTNICKSRPFLFRTRAVHLIIFNPPASVALCVFCSVCSSGSFQLEIYLVS